MYTIIQLSYLLYPLRMTNNLRMDRVKWRNEEKTIYLTSFSDSPIVKRKLLIFNIQKKKTYAKFKFSGIMVFFPLLSWREDLRRWFIQQEIDLFRYRFNELDSAKKLEFLHKNDLHYDTVSFFLNHIFYFRCFVFFFSSLTFLTNLCFIYYYYFFNLWLICRHSWA